jgi:L-asparaginase
VRPRILVISCGGTISASPPGPGQAALPAASGPELVAAVPGLADLARVDAQTFSVVPSSFATLETVHQLLSEIERTLDHQPSRDAYAGVVITHGTDTMEEVAFALDLHWLRDEPLVVTGAMRTPGTPGADGPANLLAAVATAASPDARGLGVLVVLNDQVHAASFARKEHTTRVDTFRSPVAGPLGFISERRATILLRPLRRISLGPAPSRAGVPVALLTCSLGTEVRMVTAIAAAGYGGVVIEALGGGHLPPAVAESPELARLHETVPIVIASRAGAGPTLHATYDFSGSEVQLRKRGFLFAGILDGRKARILLTTLLALGYHRADLAREFDRVSDRRQAHD